jgi:hypothetical protein
VALGVEATALRVAKIGEQALASGHRVSTGDAAMDFTVYAGVFR